jgi:hypothetical protein
LCIRLLQLLHKTKVDGVPSAVAELVRYGQVVVGLNNTVVVFDLGKKSLLRVCELSVRRLRSFSHQNGLGVIILPFSSKAVRACTRKKKTGAAARELPRRDRPGGSTSSALHACGSASPFARAVVTVTEIGKIISPGIGSLFFLACTPVHMSELRCISVLRDSVLIESRVHM